MEMLPEISPREKLTELQESTGSDTRKLQPVRPESLREAGLRRHSFKTYCHLHDSDISSQNQTPKNGQHLTLKTHT